jgi:hypothetical protein
VLFNRGTKYQSIHLSPSGSLLTHYLGFDTSLKTLYSAEGLVRSLLQGAQSRHIKPRKTSGPFEKGFSFGQICPGFPILSLVHRSTWVHNPSVARSGRRVLPFKILGVLILGYSEPVGLVLLFLSTCAKQERGPALPSTLNANIPSYFLEDLPTMNFYALNPPL